MASFFILLGLLRRNKMVVSHFLTSANAVVFGEDGLFLSLSAVWSAPAGIVVCHGKRCDEGANTRMCLFGIDFLAVTATSSVCFLLGIGYQFFSEDRLSTMVAHLGSFFTYRV